MKSVGTCIRQLSAMLGTDDLTEWEQDFIASVSNRSHGGDDTRSLTIRQVETVEKIYSRHFGD